MRIPEKRLNPETIAALLSRRRGVDFKRALQVTEKIWEEAGRSVERIVSKEEWRKLSFKDKAHICALVVKALLDRKRLSEFVSNDRKRLI